MLSWSISVTDLVFNVNTASLDASTVTICCSIEIMPFTNGSRVMGNELSLGSNYGILSDLEQQFVTTYKDRFRAKFQSSTNFFARGVMNHAIAMIFIPFMPG